MQTFIKNFKEVSIGDIAEVGGKNASLGEMINRLATKGIVIPQGFAVTASAYKHFISCNKLEGVHSKLLAGLDRKYFSNLKQIGLQARQLILSAEMPEDLAEIIKIAYKDVFAGQQTEVAVRSSATAEDLPEANFAGQHESYLNIKGEAELIRSVKRCFASLYTLSLIHI